MCMLDQSCIGLIVALIGRLWCGRGTQSWRNYMKSWRTLIGTCSDDKKSFPLFHEHRFLVRSTELLDMMCKQKRNYPVHLFVCLFYLIFLWLDAVCLFVYISLISSTALSILCLAFLFLCLSHRAFWWGCDWREEESSWGHAALHYKYSCSVQQPSTQRILQGKTYTNLMENIFILCIVLDFFPIKSVHYNLKVWDQYDKKCF